MEVEELSAAVDAVSLSAVSQGKKLRCQKLVQLLPNNFKASYDGHPFE